MHNGTLWLDQDGNPIQAHGGMIAKFKDRYYWYGEHKGADNCPHQTRVDVIGIACYSSTDLHTWKYEGLALSADEQADSYLHPSCVCERPKVIYNELNDEYLLWFHADDAQYYYAGVGVARSKHPQGPFHDVRFMQPNRLDSRDMTLFKDQNGKAVLIHSSNYNKTMVLAELNDAYDDVTGFYTSALIDQEREAPILFKKADTYYMITSGCTGWHPNAALYAKSNHLYSGWKLIDNPCSGKNYRKTFNAQASYVFESNGQYILMLDHWQPDDLQHSGYSFLPITFTEDGFEVIWQDQF